MKTKLTLFLITLLISGCETFPPSDTISSLKHLGTVEDEISAMPEESTKARAALVIGNGDYGDDKLDNPTNDAEAVGKRLEELGFDVTILTNKNYNNMKTAIEEFGQRLYASEGADIGVFFFSGHGTHENDTNYLLPVEDGEIGSHNLEEKAVSDSFILAQMDRYNKDGVNVFILDACRNNPNPNLRKKGLTRKGLKPGLSNYKSEVVVAFATAAEDTVDNRHGEDYSLYTEKLLEGLENASFKPIKEMFYEVGRLVLGASDNKQKPLHLLGPVGDDICMGTCAPD